MDGWGLVFLGVIALATLVMAAVQIGLIVYASRLAKQVDHLSDEVEHQIKPVIASVKGVADNAAQISALAVAQLERADRLFADVATRVEQTLRTVQALTGAREGLALVAALRAAFGALWTLRQGGRRPGVGAEDEEALFIG